MDLGFIEHLGPKLSSIEFSNKHFETEKMAITQA